MNRLIHQSRSETLITNSLYLEEDGISYWTHKKKNGIKTGVNLLFLSGGVAKVESSHWRKLLENNLIDHNLHHTSIASDGVSPVHNRFFICEVSENKDQPRRLVADLDLVSSSTKGVEIVVLLKILNVMYKVTRRYFPDLTPKCVVEMTKPKIKVSSDRGVNKQLYKAGVHVKFSNVVVDKERSIQIRSHWVKELEATLSTDSCGLFGTWENMVDAQIYTSGLRMTLAHKCKKCVCFSKKAHGSSSGCGECNRLGHKVIGQPYVPQFCLNGDGIIDREKSKLIQRVFRSARIMDPQSFKSETLTTVSGRTMTLFDYALAVLDNCTMTVHGRELSEPYVIPTDAPAVSLKHAKKRIKGGVVKTISRREIGPDPSGVWSNGRRCDNVLDHKHPLVNSLIDLIKTVVDNQYHQLAFQRHNILTNESFCFFTIKAKRLSTDEQDPAGWCFYKNGYHRSSTVWFTISLTGRITQHCFCPKNDCKTRKDKFWAIKPKMVCKFVQENNLSFDTGYIMKTRSDKKRIKPSFGFNRDEGLSKKRRKRSPMSSQNGKKEALVNPAHVVEKASLKLCRSDPGGVRSDSMAKLDKTETAKFETSARVIKNRFVFNKDRHQILADVLGRAVS